MTDKISVIIPVYNSEKYINACCRSIINQTYKNLEIILVNDGSNDHSLDKCQKLASHDQRIKIIDLCNNGASAARNAGIQCASGEYLCFVDSDDLLLPHAIECLYNSIKKNRADFCQGSIMSICEVHNYPFHENEDRIAERGDNTSWRLAVSGLYWGPVAALYKSSIIDNYQISFPEGIILAEDSIFVANYLRCCQRISTCKDNLYLYNRLNSRSATRKGYEDIWRWMHAFTETYAALYPDSYAGKPGAVEEIALRNLDYAYRHYVSNREYFGEKKVLHFLELVHQQLNVYLNELSADDIIQPISKVKLSFYKKRLETHQYEEIYAALIENETHDGIKYAIKSLIAPLRRIIYFGI